MGNLPLGIGIANLPGWRAADVAHQLTEEAWEESIDPDKVADALLAYFEFDLPPISEHFRAEMRDALQRICQRMTTGHLDELGRLGAHLDVNEAKPVAA